MSDTGSELMEPRSKADGRMPDAVAAAMNMLKDRITTFEAAVLELETKARELQALRLRSEFKLLL